MLDQQKQEITKKLFTLVLKWVPCMQKKSFNNFSALCNYIEENPKFKLPWTLIEARDAGEIFQSFIDNIIDNK